MKVTVDLDPELYRAVKVQAARTDRSVRDVLSDAVVAWLDHLEDAEDRASAVEALAEYERDGGVAATEFFQHLAAETRATYGSDTPAGQSAAPESSTTAERGPAVEPGDA